MSSLRIATVIVSIPLLLTVAGWSQETPGRQTFSGKAVTFDETPPANNSFPENEPQPNFEARPEPAAVSPVPESDDARLRDEYLLLIKQKSELMDELTLKREIEATQRNINELLALQKLQDAERLLLSITKDFPQSDAARQAQRMLAAAPDQASQAAYPENQPGLNTAAEESPFRRSSASRSLPALDDGLPTPSRSRLDPAREFAPVLPAEPASASAIPE